MFKKVITEEQKRVIEYLAEDHSEALTAFGADFYREGIYKGFIIAIAGIAAGVTISICFEKIKSRSTLIKTEEVES